MADAANEPAIDAIASLVPATLRALYALEFAARHLSPDTLSRLVEAIADRNEDVDAALAASRATDWPERLAPVRHCLERAAGAAAEGIAGLLGSPEAPEPIVAAYRALRTYARAAEALYPMAAHLKSVNQFFLEPAVRSDTALTDQLASLDTTREGVGVMHVGGPAGTRGGFSLYVPETCNGSQPMPLVVAMHGGSGNGGAFLWSWVREARTRNFIVIAPTAIGSTWSLMEPEVDGPNIDRMVKEVAGQWNVDPSRQLLTGMSDGGTFSYVLGLGDKGRFTHLAPVAAAFHPMMMTFASADRVRGLPIHIVHGARDWMFPPGMAREAERVLAEAGAAVIYREIVDLSHTYPRDENAAILDWFLA